MKQGIKRQSWAVLGLSVATFASVPSCDDDDYPLAPTFCDDWCHTILASDCGEFPRPCVRDCELTKASDDCFLLQEELLECYEDNPDSFVCAPGGFSDETRVADGVCQGERDVLFECEAPGIGSCLQACRGVQQEQLDTIIESPAEMMTAPETMDAGVASTCPVLDQPCEEICWTLFNFTSAGLIQAGVDPRSDAPSLLDASAGLLSGAASRQAACVLVALSACFADPMTEADAGLPTSIEFFLDSCRE